MESSVIDAVNCWSHMLWTKGDVGGFVTLASFCLVSVTVCGCAANAMPTHVCARSNYQSLLLICKLGEF